MRDLNSVPLLAAGALALLATANSTPAAATTCVGQYCYVTDDEKDDLTLFVIGANKSVTTFDASAGKNTKVPAVHINTNGAPVTTGNGNANIKGVNDTPSDLLMDITLTPDKGFSFDGVLFRGQVNDITPATHGKNGKPGSYDGDLNATVTDVSGKVFKLSWTGISSNGDFSTRGFDEAFGPGDPIRSVTLSLDNTGGYFFQLKQIDVSATPLPASWTMMLSGFAGLGFLVYRRQKRNALVLAT